MTYSKGDTGFSGANCRARSGFVPVVEEFELSFEFHRLLPQFFVGALQDGVSQGGGFADVGLGSHAGVPFQDRVHALADHPGVFEKFLLQVHTALREGSADEEMSLIDLGLHFFARTLADRVTHEDVACGSIHQHVIPSHTTRVFHSHQRDGNDSRTRRRCRRKLVV